MSKDYYKTLGVEKNASASDIKKAFYKLAGEHHPDKPGGNEAKFKEINEAYQTLSDDKKRANYDRFGSADGPAGFGGAGGGNPFGGFDFSQFTNGQGGFEFQFGGNGPIDLNDIISEMFGGSSRRNPRGRNVQVEVRLTFAESILGVDKEVEVPMYVDGKSDGKRKLKIPIPPGVDNGVTLEMSGEGEKMSNGRNGNLHIVVHVAKHPLFRKEGHNLVMDHEVKLSEAILGSELRVELVDGKTVSVDIPAGLQPGHILRVRGKGVAGRAGTGDLMVRTHIQIPKKLSREAKKALEILQSEGY